MNPVKLDRLARRLFDTYRAHTALTKLGVPDHHSLTWLIWQTVLS